MSKFFSKIFKQKKIIVFVLLFFIAIGFVVPQTASAASGWSLAACAAGGVMGGKAGAAICSIGGPWAGVICGTIGVVAGCFSGSALIEGAAISIGKDIIAGAGYLLLTIARELFNLSAQIFEGITSSDILQKSITQDRTVLNGWGIVRDFANMFIVLGFVVVGIATILRIREYEAQKLLLPLILVALLINFSPLICGIIIDATNIMMSYFLSGTNVGGVATSSMVITAPFSNIVNNPVIGATLSSMYSQGLWDQYVNLAFSYAIFAGIAAMIFFIYGLLLLFRYVALMCLVILSPLAFVCYVFPATKSIFNKWWDQFMQWAIIGVPTAFFIYLGGHIFNSFNNQSSQTIVSSPGMLGFWVPTAFLLFGYTLIFQTSAVGAGAAIGLATGAVRFAAGATGKTKVGQWVKDRTQGTKAWGAGVLEKIPLIGAPKGTAANIDTRRKEAARKEVKNMTDDQVIGVANQKRFLGGARGAAAIEEAAERKILHKLGDEQHVANRLSYAEAYGGEKTARKKAEESNYRIAGLDDKKVNELATARGIPIAQARDQVVMAQLEANLPHMSHNELRNIDNNHLTPELVNKRFTPDKIAAYRTGSIEQIDQLQNPVRIHLDSLRNTAGNITEINQLNTDIAMANTAGNTAAVNSLRGELTAANAKVNRREVDRLTKLINEIDNLL